MKLKNLLIAGLGATIVVMALGSTGFAAEAPPASLDEALRAGNIQDVLNILGPGESDPPPAAKPAPAPAKDSERHRITLVSSDGSVRDLSRTSTDEAPRAKRPDPMASAASGVATQPRADPSVPSESMPRRALPAAQPAQVPLTRPRTASSTAATNTTPQQAADDTASRVTTVSMPDAATQVAPEDREQASKELATLLKSMRQAEPTGDVPAAKPAAPVTATATRSPTVLDEDRKISKPLGEASRATPTSVPRTSVTTVIPASKTPSSSASAGGMQDPMQSTRRQLDRLLQEAKTETFGGSSAVPGTGSRAPSMGDRGWRYEGRWVEGRMDGVGVLTYPDGWRFEGEWRDGVMMGQGTLIHPDGWQYTGEWRNGTMDGHGALTYPDGWKYVGEWRDGKMHGKGELIHPRNIAAAPAR